MMQAPDTGDVEPLPLAGRVVVVVLGARVVVGAAVGTGATTAGAVGAVVVGGDVVGVIVVGTIEVPELLVGTVCCWRTIIVSHAMKAFQSHDGPKALTGTTVPHTTTATTSQETRGRALPPRRRCMVGRVRTF